jgi:hypothetical protein
MSLIQLTNLARRLFQKINPVAIIIKVALNATFIIKSINPMMPQTYLRIVRRATVWDEFIIDPVYSVPVMELCVPDPAMGREDRHLRHPFHRCRLHLPTIVRQGIQDHPGQTQLWIHRPDQRQG